ncbi:uncharacterized protein KZ484_008561 [Pholidichthys leucotaenia]
MLDWFWPVFRLPFFALIIADVYSLPIEKGYNPSISYNKDAAVKYTYQGAPSSKLSPMSVPYNAPRDVAMHVLEPGFSYVAQREPAVSVASAGPVQSGYTGASAPTRTATQLEMGDPYIQWAVPPFGYGGEEALPLHDSMPSVASEEAQLPPPGLTFQPGEFSHYENRAESGEFQSETERKNVPASPVIPLSGVGFYSSYLPHFGLGGFWGLPFPYHDVRFLTGQYPPGTVSHFSQNFEQGRDYWHDRHYKKEFADSGLEQDQGIQSPQHGPLGHLKEALDR